MPMTIPADPTLRRWLLHRVPEAEAAALETRLFDDDASQDGSFAASLREAELDLIDDYAHDRLDADERADVERHLLQTGEDRLHVTIARALAQVRSNATNAPVRTVRGRRTVGSMQAGAPPSERRHTRWKVRAAGSAMAAGVALAVLFLAGVQPRKPAIPTSTESVGAEPAVTQSVALLASTQRGAGELDITLERAATSVRLQAEVADPQADARYVLRVTDAARTVLVADDLSIHQSGPYAYVEAVIPTTSLGVGARQVIVQAQADSAPGFVWYVHTHKAD